MQRVVDKPGSSLEAVETFLVPKSSSEFELRDHRVDEVVSRERLGPKKLECEFCLIVKSLKTKRTNLETNCRKRWSRVLAAI